MVAGALRRCSQVWLPEVADGNKVVLKTKVRCAALPALRCCGLT